MVPASTDATRIGKDGGNIVWHCGRHLSRDVYDRSTTTEREVAAILMPIEPIKNDEVLVTSANDLIAELKRESDRGAVLIGITYMDELLKGLFRARIRSHRGLISHMRLQISSFPSLIFCKLEILAYFGFGTRGSPRAERQFLSPMSLMLSDGEKCRIFPSF